MFQGNGKVKLFLVRLFPIFSPKYLEDKLTDLSNIKPSGVTNIYFLSLFELNIVEVARARD